MRHHGVQGKKGLVNCSVHCIWRYYNVYHTQEMVMVKIQSQIVQCTQITFYFIFSYAECVLLWACKGWYGFNLQQEAGLPVGKYCSVYLVHYSCIRLMCYQLFGKNVLLSRSHTHSTLTLAPRELKCSIILLSSNMCAELQLHPQWLNDWEEVSFGEIHVTLLS